MMAGFFGLFGGKAQYIDEIDSTPVIEENQEAFFLDPDEALSLGNVEFMRKPKTIKHTFPKTLKGSGSEFIQAVSSFDKVKLTKEDKPIDSIPATEAMPKARLKPHAPISPVNNERRSSDNNLDAFRKMARDLKT